MSASGPGSFENDDAMDWVAELETYSDDGPIIDALNEVIDQAEDHPEVHECSVAIAAAEVVAALMGEPLEDYPEEVEAWVEGRPAPSSSMISNARYATEVVQDDSQLKDRWKESDEFEQWQASVGDLLDRLLC